MNKPLAHGGYTFFQSSYQIQGGREMTILSVAKDPGQTVVFVGYTLLVIGMIVVFFTRLAQQRMNDALIAQQMAAAVGRKAGAALLLAAALAGAGASLAAPAGAALVPEAGAARGARRDAGAVRRPHDAVRDPGAGTSSGPSPASAAGPAFRRSPWSPAGCSIRRAGRTSRSCACAPTSPRSPGSRPEPATPRSAIWSRGRR